MTQSQKEEIREIVLRTLLEVVDKTYNYPPDKWESDFERTIKEMIVEVRNKKANI